MNQAVDIRPEAANTLARSLRVLLVEDSERDAMLLWRELRRAGCDLMCERVETASAMQAALAAQPWDLVIADYNLPSFNAIAALKVLQSSGLDLPFIIVSGAIGEEIAVAAMRAGAHDYVMKGHLARLLPAIERELREADVRAQRRRAEAAGQQEAEISAGLARIGGELIALLDTTALCERLCQLTSEVLRCDGCHVVLWQQDQGAYVPVAGWGDTPEQWESIQMLKLPRPLVVHMLRAPAQEIRQVGVTEVSDPLLSAVARQLGLTVILQMALRRGDEIIGFLAADYRGRTAPFAPRQERIARGIAHLGSLALEHSRIVADLEQANRLKSDFLATMSHELRTPLNVIIGYNDVVLDGTLGDLTPLQTDSLRRVSVHARLLLELIDATLDLGRLEAGHLPLDLQETRLSDLMGDIDQETREAQEQRPNVHVAWHLADDLPLLCTDPMKLKVALKNVIANAVKFTDEGGVRIDAVARDGGIEIAVADTGIGIAPEALAIIFDPFRQVDSSMTRRHNGVGLGLYLTRRLLQLLGGTVRVESEVARGSCFHVWVPSKVPGSREHLPEV